MTTDAARKAVFNTPELLENIISFIPPADILTKVQRLSRQWKDVVESSRIIRKQLWLRVPSVSTVRPTSFTDAHTFPGLAYWGTPGMPLYPHTVAFNPLPLESTAEPFRVSPMDERQVKSIMEVSGSRVRPQRVKFSCQKASSRADCSFRSSWRDTYLTDPPITTAFLNLNNSNDFEGRFGPSYITLSVRDQNGLTFGMVHDAIMAGLPANVQEDLRTTGSRFIGFLYAAYEAKSET